MLTFYPDLTELMRLLPRRSRDAIKFRAQMLGATRPRGIPWEPEEDRALRLMNGRMPLAHQADLIGRTREALERRRGQLGLWKRTPRVGRQSPINQDVRAHLSANGISIRSVGAKDILRVGTAKTKPSSDARIAQLAMAMGAEIYIQWSA